MFPVRDPDPAARDSRATIIARDRVWVERIRTGDMDAFESMFRAYKDSLGAFIERCVGSRDAMEDVLQNLFIRLWERRDDWELTVPLNVYLFRAARNSAISYLRHQRIETRFQERVAREGDTTLEPAAPTSGEEAAHLKDVEDAIERAVAQLPPRCREVFCLSRYQQLSYAEIAQVMQISVKTVEVQMGRALTALRARLAGWRD